jgi:hypothetical protein
MACPACHPPFAWPMASCARDISLILSGAVRPSVLFIFLPICAPYPLSRKACFACTHVRSDKIERSFKKKTCKWGSVIMSMQWRELQAAGAGSRCEYWCDHDRTRTSARSSRRSSGCGTGGCGRRSGCRSGGSGGGGCGRVGEVFVERSGFERHTARGLPARIHTNAKPLSGVCSRRVNRANVKHLHTSHIITPPPTHTGKGRGGRGGSVPPNRRV